MNSTRQWIPAAGLLATIVMAGYAIIQLDGQARGGGGDFTKAVAAEVKDAQGQVNRRGTFVQVDEEDDDIEVKARLEPAGADGDASGEAEVEFSRTAPASQEIEFSIRNVTPESTFTFSIDGIDVGTARSNARGRAGIDLDVPTTASPAR